MSRLLRALPLCVLVAAAVERASAGLRLPWRDLGPGLFAQAFVPWLAFGVLALPPAALTLRLAGRGRSRAEAPRPATAFAVLAAWMAAPVAAHAALDRHVGLGGDFGALAAPRPWLEVALVLALVLGVAWGVARLSARVARGAALAAGAGALLVGVLPWGPRGASAPADVSAATGPNLLLVVWDTCRADRLVPYGYERDTTPHLARFAEEALLFEDVVSPSVFTFSSHLSMLTGVRPSTHGARLLAMRYDPARATSATETLRNAGYRTGAFVGTDVLAGRTGIRAGFDVYDDRVDPRVCDTHAWRLVHDLQSLAARFVPARRGNGLPHWFQDFQRGAGEVLARASSWIRSVEEEEGGPWFCFVNLYDAHWPYLPRGDGRALVSPYDGPMDGYLFRSDDWVPGYEPTERDRRYVGELYDGELHELDAAFDAFLGELALDRGRTAVLVTSDHGEAFGEGGAWKHEDVGEAQLRIPLLLRLAEERPAGRRVPAPVAGVDVAPTLLALAGLETDDADEGAGRSLLGDLDPGRARLVEDRDHLDPLDVRVALYEQGWKLVRRGLGAEARFELFDLARDPAGLVDVAGEHPERLAELRARLERMRAAADAREGAGPPDGEGPRDLGGLRALGYTGD